MTLVNAPSSPRRNSGRTLGLVCSVLAALLVDAAQRPDGLVVVSRHGVRRQFPSSTHDFEKYAPGKKFETEDAVSVFASGMFLVGVEGSFSLCLSSGCFQKV